MEHDILGEVEQSDGHPFDAVATVWHGSRDEAQEDGSLKRVSNPNLSEAEFEAKLTLNAVNVTGGRMIDFFYDDERMFWGHSVFVNSTNGTDLSEARAEIFG